MATIFINDDVFPSDGDYIIGGFETDQVDDFSESTIISNFKERLKRLIDDYLKRAEDRNTDLGIEDPKSKARKDLLLILNDTLLIKPEFWDDETVLESIMESSQATKWVEGVRENISWANAGQAVNSKYRGIYNKSVEKDKESLEYKNAEYFTNDTTLETLLEHLSMIEL